MANDGVRTIDLDTLSTADDLIGNFGGNVGRIPLSSLAQPGVIVKQVYDDPAALIASLEPSRGDGAGWQDKLGHHFKEAPGASALISPANPDGYHLITDGEVKQYVLPDGRGLNAVAFGADPKGLSSCDAAIARAVTAAKILGQNVILPGGKFRVETGLVIQGNSSISGYSTKIGIFGAGLETTEIFSHGAPDYVIRVDGRYVSLGNLTINGSVDDIRDSAHSAGIGLWIENMREGVVVNVKIKNIVGPGLQINKCIVSHFPEVIVYRCGSATKPAVHQTDAAQDGFQHAWIALSCEDAVGPVGAMIMTSYRNSHITAKFENQPQVYVEFDTAVGQALRDEVVTFSGGATGTIALTSNDPGAGVNGNGMLIVQDLSGAVLSGETWEVTTGSSGASGTVTVAPTRTTGPQFAAPDGEYGTFDIYANQNRLKGDLDQGDITFGGDDCQIIKAQVRGPHVGYGVVFSGSRNAASLVYVDQGLTDAADEASRYDAVLFSAGAANNTVQTLRSRNSKGVDNVGARNRIDQLDQTNLYGRSYRGQGNYSGVVFANVQQLADLAITSPVNLQGDGTFFGTGGGVIDAPAATGEVVLLAGERARVGGLDIRDIGSANYGIRMTGEATRAEGGSVTIAAGKTGIQNVATRGQVINWETEGGAKGIYARNSGAVVSGCHVSGYTGIGIHFDPASSAVAMRAMSNTLFSAGGGASADIQFADTVSKSIASGNLHTTDLGAVGTFTQGSGTGNVFTDNIS